MKALRITVVILFLISSVLFGVYEFNAYRNEDNQAPVITADSDEVTVSIYDDDSAYTAGMYANDNKDGDVSDGIVPTSASYFITGHTFRQNYAAFDSHNNVASYSRMVTFSDYTSPRFSISQPMRFSSSSTGDYLQYITAEDCIEGDITSQIKIVSQDYYYYYNSSESSTFPVIFQVTNKFGDISEITVNISIETAATYNSPSAALSTYLVYTPLNTGIDYTSYIQGIWRAGAVYSFADYGMYGYENIRVDSSRVDYSVPGTYTVVYMLMDENEEVIGTTDLLVVVEDSQ